jgi:glycosyltransferase involved in cell wall biosynthesis
MYHAENTETVSVIIPTFNRQQVIARAIDSVLAQKRPADEIIIVDDGSTDGTEALIKRKYPALTYLRQNKHGVSHARNRGIKAAEGKWLAFLDSDDVWLPEKLEKQLKALFLKSSFKICHTDEIWIRRGQRVNPMKKHVKSGGDIFNDCLPLCVISPSTVILHHTLFERYGLFDESLPVCEDYDLWLRLCAFEPVLFLPEALIIKYGGHPDQLSRTFWGMDRFRIRALEKIITNPDLSEKKRLAAVRMIQEKIAIYLKGAVKRNRTEEIETFEALNKKYQALLEKT